MLVKADVLDNSVFDVIHNIHDMEEEEDDQNDDMFSSKLHNAFQINSLIEFVTGALLRYTNKEEVESVRSEPELVEEDVHEFISMDKFAEINKLDMKQSLAFKIVCATFILDCIEKDIYYKLKETSRDDNTRKILSNMLSFYTKKHWIH